MVSNIRCWPHVLLALSFAQFWHTGITAVAQTCQAKSSLRDSAQVFPLLETLIPQLSARLNPSTPSVCSSISFVVRHTLTTLFNLATVNTLDPSYTALLRLYHSTYHLLAHCVVYLYIMFTVYYLFQPEYKFPKCRDCCLFCSPTRYFINTCRMNEWHKTQEVQWWVIAPLEGLPLGWVFQSLYLVQFLELHHLEEDVFKDMFSILLVLW